MLPLGLAPAQHATGANLELAPLAPASANTGSIVPATCGGGGGAGGCATPVTAKVSQLSTAGGCALGPAGCGPPGGGGGVGGDGKKDALWIGIGGITGGLVVGGGAVLAVGAAAVTSETVVGGVVFGAAAGYLGSKASDLISEGFDNLSGTSSPSYPHPSTPAPGTRPS